MPLVIAPLNKDMKVIKILADEKTKKHLESLGITINATIKVLSSQGNIIVGLKEGRLALDSTIATKIIVA